MVQEHSEPQRWDLADYPIARAFVLSLMFHCLVFIVVELGHQTGLWKATFLFPAPPKPLDAQLARLLEQARQNQPPTEEVPLVFVEVDPSQAVEEAPKETKYYSSLNSRAANPDTKLDTGVPKIEGKQTRVPQTLERARPQPQPLQPAPAPPEPQVAEKKSEPEPEPEPEPPPAKPEAPPETPTHPGDLAMVKPAEKPMERPPEKPVEKPRILPEPKPPAAKELLKSPRTRPRRLEEAMQQKGVLAGDRMRQQGGVKRFSVVPSLDARATPFGTYDAAIIAAIQKRWYDLLDARSFAGNFSGRVVLEFRLYSDGSVTDLRVSETDVSEILALLCQRAVQDPSPFAKWPADLRRMVGKEYRDVRFTFYYN